MRSLRLAVSFLLASLLTACVDDGLDPAAPARTIEAPVFAAKTEPVDGSYIVVLKDGEDPRVAAGLANARPKFVYEAALNGFAADLTPGQLNALRHMPSVAFIEEDQWVSLDFEEILPGGQPWGIDRIDTRDLPLSGTYTYASTGVGVYAYVIDTGIDTEHTEFGGRAVNVADFIGGNGTDCNGHGTHVSGTIGGATYGVAKAVNLRGVRVLNCSGSGTYAQVIAGINWVQLNRVDPAVANLSIGGGFSNAVNTAVNNLAASGVFVAVAAGNENTDACTRSPSSAAEAFTTAASTITDARATFSNFGGCVDAYAPGVSILSAWIGAGNDETNTISGTSMAAPHVAGVISLWKQWLPNTYTSSQLSAIFKYFASPNRISGNPAGTNNLLLYKGGL